MDFIIKIPFKIFGFNLFYRRYRRTMPVAWTNIKDSGRRLFYFKIVQLDPSPAAFLSIIKDILGLKAAVFNTLNTADVGVLIEHLAFMRHDLEATPLVAEFIHEGVLYHFPKPDFDNGKAFDFALADEYYTQYAQNSEDFDALILLTSALSKADGSDINTREMVENRLETFKLLPVEIVLVALRYFEAVKKDVFSIGNQIGLFDEDAPESEENTADKPIHFGWWTSYRYIAKSQVFGDFEKVCNTLFWDVFKYLIEEKQREIAMQKLYKSNPSHE